MEPKIVKVIPRIDGMTAKNFDEQLKATLEDGTENLVLDMDDTVYVSSAGLRVFLSTQKAINARGGSMVLRNVKQQIFEVFEVTGFAGVLTIE